MRRTRTLLALCIAIHIVGTTDCRRSNQSPIVVNLLRNEKSRAFGITEPKLLEFESQHPKTSSGRSIIVQSILMNEAQFERTLVDQAQLSAMKPDLVVLDSPDQIRVSSAIEAEAANATNVCGSITNCPAFVPTWVSGERLDAIHAVLKALSSNT